MAQDEDDAQTSPGCRRVESDPSGDFIGTLLATNEQILSALALYDRMCKPVELDSDDDEIAAIRTQAGPTGLEVPPGVGAGADDDANSIRSKLSAFDLQDREVDKLQAKQRRRVERVNSYRAQQVHPDLADLSFAAPAAR